MRQVIGVIVIVLSSIFGLRSAAAVTIPTTDSMSAGYHAAITADVAASVWDPVLQRDIWTTGDVTSIQGTDTTGYYGYMHGALLTEEPGSTTFTPVTFNTEQFGTDYWGNNMPNPNHFYQPWPNYANGEYFWAAFMLYSNNVLHVYGVELHNTDAGGIFNFVIDKTADVHLNATTLAYEGIYVIPGPGAAGQSWSGAVASGSGYYFVSPAGIIDRVGASSLDSGYTLKTKAAPVTSGSWLIANPSGGWDMFGSEVFGYDVNEYHAASVTGPWSSATAILTMPVQEVDGGVICHPELPAPTGQVLCGWLENDPNYYGPHFFYTNK